MTEKKKDLISSITLLGYAGILYIAADKLPTRNSVSKVLNPGFIAPLSTDYGDARAFPNRDGSAWIRGHLFRLCLDYGIPVIRKGQKECFGQSSGLARYHPSDLRSIQAAFSYTFPLRTPHLGV